MVLASYCDERLTDINAWDEREENGLIWIGQCFKIDSFNNDFFLLPLFLCSSWFPPSSLGNKCFLSFYMLHQLIGQSEFSYAFSARLALSAHVQLDQVAMC